MRILYLCTDNGIPVLGRKGGAVHVREMVAAFARAGHRVILAAPATVDSPWDRPAAVDAEVLHLPVTGGTDDAFRRMQAYLARLEEPDSLAREARRMLHDGELEAAVVRALRSNPPDFIYARASTFSTAPVAIARQLGRPLLLELNAPLAAEQSAYRGGALGEVAARAERYLTRGADAVMVVSAPLRAHVEQLGVPADRIHVFPNGIDPAVFHPAPRDPEVRARWGLPAGRLLGFVGGLRAWHGVETLPELLARVAGRHPDASLAIVGDGPLRPALDAKLAELGLADRACFTGAVPHGEVPRLMREFDVALAPYPPLAHDFYFSPLKLFEYMACGVPVAAPRVGQIADVVTDGETGLLYEAGDLGALADACDRLLASRDLRERIGSAAARLMHDSYTWDHNAARAVELARALAA